MKMQWAAKHLEAGLSDFGQKFQVVKMMKIALVSSENDIFSRTGPVGLPLIQIDVVNGSQ